MGPQEWRRGDLRITTDPAAVDLDVVHGFLTTSYWAAGVGRDVLARAIAGSIPFSLLDYDRQVGFARVITDGATFAYVHDVFVVDAARGRGLGVWLVESILAHRDLQGLRMWRLTTRDAHGLYARFGFGPPAQPERLMEYRPAGAIAGASSPASAQ
jgi:GNAT superfamily N-acetyltransferase